MRVRARKGNFVVIVDWNNNWIYYDAGEIDEEKVLEVAKELSRERDCPVYVYLASREYEVTP